MTGGHTSHITVSYRSGICETICTYAITEDVSRELSHSRNRLGQNLTGKRLETWLKEKGCQLDSSSGAALIWRGYDDGHMIEHYYRNGVLHRDDGPAFVMRDETGPSLPITEQYYRDGKLHRDDGPAVVWNYGTSGREEAHYRDGKLHREDGPAWIVHHVTGDVTEEYHHNGKLHREDGPARIVRHADGSTEEWYCRDGKLHREGGPAIVNRHADGSTDEMYYWKGNLMEDEPSEKVPYKPKPTVKPGAPGPT
jgi:hypothetical protein